MESSPELNIENGLNITTLVPVKPRSYLVVYAIPRDMWYTSYNWEDSVGSLTIS